jgi:hypothetical protein
MDFNTVNNCISTQTIKQQKDYGICCLKILVWFGTFHDKNVVWFGIFHDKNVAALNRINRRQPHPF